MPRPQPQSANTDKAIAELATELGGAFATRDAEARGIPRSALYRRADTGRLQRVLPQVFVPAGMASTFAARVSAAHAWVGTETVFSGTTALFLLGLGKEPVTVTMSSTRNRKSPVPWLAVRRVAALPDADIVKVGRYRMIAPCRAIFEAAPGMSDVDLSDLIDKGRRRGLASLARLRWYCTRDGGPRRGSKRILRLLDEKQGYGWTESKLEIRTVALITRYKLPQPERQFVIKDAKGKFIGRMDLVYPGKKLIIECDSVEHHDGKSAMDRDRIKWNKAGNAGYDLLWATWDNTEGDGLVFINELRARLGPVSGR